jgi:DNA-directed RNA polymerase subunit RPC12/RpoP
MSLMPWGMFRIRFQPKAHGTPDVPWLPAGVEGDQEPEVISMEAALIVVVLIIAALVIYGMSPGVQAQIEKEQQIKAKQDSQIVCPQCHSKGHATTRKVTLKKGVSGGKATGAILTGGLSLLATGLSRKEDATEAKCSNCGSVWHF